jgi:glycosyltransferase involved in cell wall biosynthesis
LNILIIGSNYTWSIERIYKRELETLGHEVELLDVQNQFYDYYYKNLFHKLIYRIGISGILSKINKGVLSQVSSKHYELIWVFKGMELFPDTLRVLKSKSKKLINYNPDNPFIFSGKGSGNRNVTKGISLYDLHLTYDDWVKKKIEMEYNIQTELLPFGFDAEAISDEELNAIVEINAVCFLGNPDKYRASIIQKLVDQQIEVHLYGNDWQKFVNHRCAIIHQPVYGQEFYKTLRKYRVQLNIMRAHNLNSHNMRSIEIPGAGGVMLAPKTADHLAFFTLGEEIFVYGDTEILISETQRLLNLDKSEVEQIRKSARRTVLKEFTYKVQTQRILSIVNEA